MTYGLQITTNSGELLVSDTGKTLHFIGFAAKDASFVHDVQVQYNISSPGRRPLVLVRGLAVGDTIAVLSTLDLGNGSWGIRVAGTARNLVQVLCYTHLVLDEPLQPYGLRVLDKNGEVTFDSSRCPFWISEVFAHTQSTTDALISESGRTWAYTYNSPAVMAYACRSMTVRPERYSSSTTTVLVLGIKRTSTGHQLYWCYSHLGTSTSPEDEPTYNSIDTAIIVSETAGVT